MSMEVKFSSETETRLQELAETTGRRTDDLVEDAMAGYLVELGEVRATLDRRYEDVQNDRVALIDADEVFGRLHRKGEERRRRA
jgi:predicted transcriptional regulator